MSGEGTRTLGSNGDVCGTGVSVGVTRSGAAGVDSCNGSDGGCITGNGGKLDLLSRGGSLSNQRVL